MNTLELADGVPPALWANPKTEIHGIVDVRTYPLEGFIPLCVKHDADTMLRQQQAEIEVLKAELNLYKPEDDENKTVCHACDGTGLCDRA